MLELVYVVGIEREAPAELGSASGLVELAREGLDQSVYRPAMRPGP
jgi:hypothetical protein